MAGITDEELDRELARCGFNPKDDNSEAVVSRHHAFYYDR